MRGQMAEIRDQIEQLTSEIEKLKQSERLQAERREYKAAAFFRDKIKFFSQKRRSLSGYLEQLSQYSQQNQGYQHEQALVRRPARSLGESVQSSAGKRREWRMILIAQKVREREAAIQVPGARRPHNGRWAGKARARAHTA